MPSEGGRTDIKEAAAAKAGGESALEKAFTQLYDVYYPCYQSYNTNLELESNKTARTPSLQLHEHDARPHEHFQWDPSTKIHFPCPVCAHVSTAQFSVDTVDVDVMGTQHVAAAAVMTTSNSGCFCYRINCHGKHDGLGCFLCEEKARDNVPPITNKPGICKWKCPVCVCHCSCTFIEKNRATIAVGWKKLKEKESAKISNQPTAAGRSEEVSDLIALVKSHIGEGSDGAVSQPPHVSWSDGEEYYGVEEQEDDDKGNNAVYGKNVHKRRSAAFTSASIDILHNGEVIVECLMLVLFIILNSRLLIPSPYIFTLFSLAEIFSRIQNCGEP